MFALIGTVPWSCQYQCRFCGGAHCPADDVVELVDVVEVVVVGVVEVVVVDEVVLVLLVVPGTVWVTVGMVYVTVLHALLVTAGTV
jgi:hypothetical protein